MKPECPRLKLSRHFTAHLLTIIGAVFLPIGQRPRSTDWMFLTKSFKSDRILKKEKKNSISPSCLFPPVDIYFSQEFDSRFFFSCDGLCFFGDFRIRQLHLTEEDLDVQFFKEHFHFGNARRHTAYQCGKLFYHNQQLWYYRFDIQLRMNLAVPTPLFTSSLCASPFFSSS